MERRLGAILAIDVVGHSRRMEADEPGTFFHVFGGDVWIPRKMSSPTPGLGPDNGYLVRTAADAAPRHGTAAAEAGGRMFVFGGSTETGAGAVDVDRVLSSD